MNCLFLKFFHFLFTYFHNIPPISSTSVLVLATYRLWVLISCISYSPTLQWLVLWSSCTSSSFHFSSQEFPAKKQNALKTLPSCNEHCNDHDNIVLIFEAFYIMLKPTNLLTYSRNIGLSKSVHDLELLSVFLHVLLNGL